MKIFQGDKIYGVFLFLLGVCFMYLSLSAVYSYFETGVIAWGRSPRRATGETALLFHAATILAGAWLSAHGIFRIFPSNAPAPDGTVNRAKGKEDGGN